MHLAYEGDLGEAVYATREEGGWTREIIDQSAAWIRLALGSGGEPVASYYDSAGENLKFAVRTGTGWEVETGFSWSRFFRCSQKVATSFFSSV